MEQKALYKDQSIYHVIKNTDEYILLLRIITTYYYVLFYLGC